MALWQIGAAGTAALAATNRNVRHGFAALIVGHVLAGLLVVHELSALTLPQRVEVFSVVIGATLLAIGHAGWRREGELADQAVSFQLQLGSILCSLPISVGLLAHRLSEGPELHGWVLFHELGVLAIGLLLLGSGVLCRICSTTLAGAGMLGAYVLSLVVLIHLPEQLQTVAVYMMIGGATCFMSAVMLSIYRDHLLTMPDKIRRKDGIFRVLKWR